MRSAKAMGLKPLVDRDVDSLVRDGLKQFERDAASFTSGRCTGPRRRRLAPCGSIRNRRAGALPLCRAVSAAAGTAITLSPFRRPTRETALVEAKAGCALSQQCARALLEARSRGFDNCLMCDMLGNVAELGTANVFMAKDGVVFTPVANGTFLSGITRARVIALLREAGVSVVETTLRYADFQSADEIFPPATTPKWRR